MTMYSPIIHIIPECIQLIALAFLIGTLACGIWIVPTAFSEFPEKQDPRGRAWRLFGVCIATLIVTSVFGFLLRGLEVSDLPLSDLLGMLPAVVLQTHFGRIWAIRVAALLLLAVAFIAGERIRHRREGLFLLLGFSIVISMTESASGHASGAGDFSLPEIMDWLHLTAASLWAGGLLVLTTSVLPALEKREWDSGTAWMTTDIARRFSAMAAAAVVLVAISACYNGFLYVGGFAPLVKTSYGRIALIKLLLFAAAISLGAKNRFAGIPQLSGAGGSEPLRRFSRWVRLEALLILVILLCTAVLRREIPSSHLVKMETQTQEEH